MMEPHIRTTRRAFLLGMSATSAVVLAAACGQAAQAPAPTAAPPAKPAAPDKPAAAEKAAAPAAPPAKPAWEAEWDQWLVEARKEGSLVMNVYPGEQESSSLKEFEKAFPGIGLEMTRLVANEHTPRVLQEIKAGVYSWDIAMLPASTPSLFDMKAAGVWDPLKPLLIRPDVKEDQYWIDGFEAGWLDSEKQYAYGAAKNIRLNMWVDSNVVKPEELKNAKDLLDPKWKGKMVWTDPRSSGFSWVALTNMRLQNGDDIVKQLLVDQEVVFVRDPRQATEFIVRGRYPIAIGATKEVLEDFKNEGLGSNIKPVYMPDAIYVNHLRQPYIHKNGPHPYATKVFVNWFLGPDGQRAWSSILGANSRRKDTPPGDPETVVDPARPVWVSDSEQGIREQARTQELAREVIKV